MAHLHLDIPGFVILIINRLKEAGHEAYVVGGAVRDGLLGRPIKDWDVTTSAPAHHIRTIFHDQRQFSLRHDTVTLVHADAHFEVSPFRGADRRLIGDLARRDFTIDAMALDPEGSAIIDPFGGRSDIRHGILRCVFNPEDRFREDPLRVMRCIRLAAELGFKIDRGTLTGLRATASLLSSVAPERIRDELTRILMTPKPSPSFYLMVRTGVLSSFLPELLEGYRKRQNPYHRHTIFRHLVETADHIRPDPVLRLAAVFHDVAKPRTRVKKGGAWRFYGHEEEGAAMAQAILSRLRFSTGLTQRVVHLVRHHMIGYESSWSDAAIRRLLRRVGPDAIQDLMALRRADLLAHGTPDTGPDLTDELEARLNHQIEGRSPTRTKDLAVDGHLVMALAGLSPGPAVGKVLQALTEKVLEHPEWNNRDDLTAIIRSMGNTLVV